MNVPSQNIAGITFDQYIKTTLYMYIQQVVEVLSGTRIQMIISDANKNSCTCIYRVFHRFRQAKFDNGVPILSLSQFSLLPQLPQKMKLASNVVKIDSK
jgi:hypothetical protein